MLKIEDGCDVDDSDSIKVECASSTIIADKLFDQKVNNKRNEQFQYIDCSEQLINSYSLQILMNSHT